MTKPQALPFIVPFAAFAFRRLGTQATRRVRWNTRGNDRRAVEPVSSCRRASALPPYGRRPSERGLRVDLSRGLEPVVACWTGPPAKASCWMPVRSWVPLNARQIGLGLAALGEADCLPCDLAQTFAAPTCPGTGHCDARELQCHDDDARALLVRGPDLPCSPASGPSNPGDVGGLSVAITANMLLIVPPWAPIEIPTWIVRTGRRPRFGRPSGDDVGLPLAPDPRRRRGLCRERVPARRIPAGGQ
jgi:hypothetical protein